MILDIAANIAMRGGIRNYFLLHWYTRNADSLERYGDLFVLYLFFGLGLQLTLTSVASLAMLRKLQSGAGGWALGISLTTMALNMVATGNRIFIALFLLFIGSAAIFPRRYAAIAKMTLLLPVLVVVFAIWAQVRCLVRSWRGADRHLDSGAAHEGNHVLNRLIDVTEGTNIIFLLNVSKDFGQRFEFLSGQTFLKTFTFWIPRSVYPDKPESFLRDRRPPVRARRRDQHQLDDQVASELFANFGYLTLLLLPFVTVVVQWVDGWISSRHRRNPVLCVALFLAFAWMARASFSDTLAMIGFTACIVLGLRLQNGLIISRAHVLPQGASTARAAE